MRLAVLADVHANLPALEAVLEDTEAGAVDGYLVAGDLLAGPYPDESVRLLQSLGAAMILGNSDVNQLRYGTADAPAEWATARQWALLRWSHEHTAPETRAAVAALPEQRSVALPGTAAIRLVHGSPRSPFEGLRPAEKPEQLSQALASIAEAVLICGHTHESWQTERDGRLALNPGAVCGPLNGDVRAQYAWLEWHGGRWHARLRAVAYDLGRIRRAFEERGLLADGGALARAFLLSIELARDVSRDFLHYAHALEAASGYAGGTVVPDAIWDRAAREFPWPG